MADIQGEEFRGKYAKSIFRNVQGATESSHLVTQAQAPSRLYIRRHVTSTRSEPLEEYERRMDECKLCESEEHRLKREYKYAPPHANFLTFGKPWHSICPMHPLSLDSHTQNGMAHRTERISC